MTQQAKKLTLPKEFFLLILFVLLAAGVFYLPYKVVRQSTLDSLNAQQALLGKQIVHGIEEFFNIKEQLLRHLAQHASIIRFPDKEGEVLMEDFFHANASTISAVTRIDPAGRILYTVPFRAAAIGQDVSSQEHNRLIIEKHEPVVSAVFKSVQGYVAVALAVPVFEQGAYAGSLSVLIPFQVIAEKYLANIILGENGYAWMINREGVELYCPVPDHVGHTVYETSSRFPSVITMAEKMMAGESGQTTYIYDRLKEKRQENVLKHAVYQPVHLPHNLWSVVIETPENEALAAIKGFGRWWSGTFMALVTLLFGYFYIVFRARVHSEEQGKREETEKRLAESQQLFGKFINAAHVPIAIVNIDGKIEFLNEKCEELYGYTQADIPTMAAWFDKVYPEQGLQRVIVKSWKVRLEEARHKRFSVAPEERAIVCKDGSIKDVEFAYTLIEDRMIITLNDKTEQNRVERQKKELAQRTIKIKKMEALGLLAGGVAHDLNNILSGVVSYPELLLMKLPPESNMRPALELIQQSGQQAAAVVADLLTVARGVASVKKTVNVNKLIAEFLASAEVRNIAARHGDVSWAKELAPDLAHVSCSAVHVKKCLMNLMINGAEAITGTGQILVATRNQVMLPEQAKKYGVAAGAYVVISVRDSGCGINEQDKEHIFEPFYTKKEMGRSGTGLGLAVVWNTMQDHVGVVTVMSTAFGTTFELFFPASNEALSDQQEKVDLQEFMGHGEKILVVDDQAFQRDIACQFLTYFHYECHAVASGEEALDYLSEHHTDLVVLDMIMGLGMDGCQTYAALVRIKPDLKAIIASGFSANDHVKEAQRLGAGDFIKKPYSMKELGLAVQRSLAGEVKPQATDE